MGAREARPPARPDLPAGFTTNSSSPSSLHCASSSSSDRYAGSSQLRRGTPRQLRKARRRRAQARAGIPANNQADGGAQPRRRARRAAQLAAGGARGGCRAGAGRHASGSSGRTCTHLASRSRQLLYGDRDAVRAIARRRRRRGAAEAWAHTGQHCKGTSQCGFVTHAFNNATFADTKGGWARVLSGVYTAPLADAPDCAPARKSSLPSRWRSHTPLPSSSFQVLRPQACRKAAPAQRRTLGLARERRRRLQAACTGCGAGEAISWRENNNGKRALRPPGSRLSA